MNNFRRKLAAFFYRNSSKGFSNLMLYIAVGNVIVYLISLIDPSQTLVSALMFDPSAILQGQVWRLFTVVFLDVSTSSYRLLAMLCMLSYYWIGRVIEQYWGVLKFTLYYFGCLLVTDLVALLASCTFLPGWINMTVFLIFAIAAPEASVRFMGIVPLKTKYLAWLEIGLTLFDVISGIIGARGLLWLTPLLVQLLMPLVPIVFFCLFVRRDLRLLFPDFLRYSRTDTQKNYRRYQTRQKSAQHPSANWSANYRSGSGEKPYRHKCTVCGRTDVTNPELEFRYCSKCNGYYCYCMDHINNHVHIK